MQKSYTLKKRRQEKCRENVAGNSTLGNNWFIEWLRQINLYKAMVSPVSSMVKAFDVLAEHPGRTAPRKRP
jgi:hypothetical protein